MGLWFFCCIGLHNSKQCLQVLCLAGLPFSWPFNYQEQCFFRPLFFFFLCLCPLASLGCWLLWHPVWAIRGRKPRELTAMSILESQCTYLICLLLFTVQSLLLFVLNTMSWVFSYTQGQEQGKLVLIPSFWKYQSLKVILILQNIPGL